MNINRKLVGRYSALVAAFALAIGTVIPILPRGAASAAQLSGRAIKMSNSTPSASAQYELTFTASNSFASLIVDFCANTPLVSPSGSDVCTFSAATVPTVGAGITSSSGTAVQKGSGTPIHTIEVTGLSGAAGSYTITFSAGITNPTTAAGVSFYARVVTYTAGNSSTYTQANTSGNATSIGSSYVDYGGIALSTVQQVQITARVMETLTFCVSGSDLSSNSNCGAATAPTIDIGTGSPTKVLDPSRVDAATVYTQLSTNASSGAIIRMKATNTCANSGLSNDGGTTCNIPGITDGTYTTGEGPISMVAGTAAFGLFVSDSALTTGVSSSSGTVTPDANYNDGTHETEGTPSSLYYGMDNRNTPPNGVRSTYGDVIAASTAAVSQVNNHLVFGATPSLTTPAGIYQGNEILIATGTF